MTSVVYYKFKSQKEPSRVNFDGTGISVFDLKREILLANKLAATADQFDLHIINPDTKEEYEDDSEVIPRSMSVMARRLPTSRPGKDSAIKYVTGAMPTMSRRGGPGSAQAPAPSAPALPTSGAGASGTEDDMISAMLQQQGEQWKQTQEHMANAAPVYHSKKGPIQPVPDHPPPPGYICYRCGQKGHWIQACPTNNDPNWEGKRVRRTTGIPRSMLRTVAKPDPNADTDNNNYMINEDGEYVVAVADNASWNEFQTRAMARNEKKNERPDDPELEDPISHKLFVKPVKTPCCGKTYSDEAIQQALLDRDFVCPNCGTEEVLLDQLTPDTEMEERVRKYKESKAAAAAPAPAPAPASTAAKNPAQAATESAQTDSDSKQDSAKRKREDSEGAESQKVAKKDAENGSNSGNGPDSGEKKPENASGNSSVSPPNGASGAPGSNGNAPGDNKGSTMPPNPAAMPWMMPNGMPFMPPPMPGVPMPPFMPPMPGMPMPPWMMPMNMMNNQNQGQPPMDNRNWNKNGRQDRYNKVPRQRDGDGNTRNSDTSNIDKLY